MLRANRLLTRYLGFPDLNAPAYRLAVQCGWALALVAVLLRAVFWMYTDRVWEDALITVLHSENFASGLGLTHYKPGEPPLHGFTSPLSVLIPLMGDVFHVGFGLHFIRLVSVFAGGMTVLYLLAIALHPRIRLPWPLAVLAMAYAAWEHHQILWGMSGMETQMVSLALVMSMYYTLALNPAALGVSLGLCMLARPDFAFWTVIAGGYVLVHSRRQFAVTAAVALAVYAPWLLFTTAYYGSPAPNTILAKHLGYYLWLRDPNLTVAEAWINIRDRVLCNYRQNTVFQPLGPSFASHGAHYRPLLADRGLIAEGMMALAAVGAAAALWRRQYGWLPILLFAAVYVLYYVFLVNVIFGWYLAPFLLAFVLLAARGLEACGGILKRPRFKTAFWLMITALYAGCFLVFLPKTFATEKRVQEDIENVVRKQIGLFLSRVMQPDQLVGSECLGYVSYYSRRGVLDWPGLASRRVVEFNRKNPAVREVLVMFEVLKPEFVVIRYFEYTFFAQRRWLDDDYRIAASFEASETRIRDILGIGDNIDTGFFVLARNDIAQQIAGQVPGINPKHARAYRTIGCRLAQQGRFDEALAAYDIAIRIAPEAAEGYYNFANTLTAMNRYDEAIAQFQHALEADPNHLNSRINVGVALAHQGRLAEAITEYEAALRLAPGDPSTLNNLGSALARSGRFEDAIAAFRQAIRSDPQSPGAYCNLATALMQTNRLEEARASLGKALEADPQYEPARRLLQQLEARGHASP